MSELLIVLFSFIGAIVILAAMIFDALLIPSWLKARRRSRLLALSDDGRPDLVLKALQEPKNEGLDHGRNLEASSHERLGNFSEALALQLGAVVLPPKSLYDLIGIYNTSCYYADLGDMENARKYLKCYVDGKALLKNSSNRAVEKNEDHLEKAVEIQKSRILYFEKDNQIALHRYLENLEAVSSKESSTEFQELTTSYFKAEYEWKYGSKELAERIYHNIIGSGTAFWYVASAIKKLERLEKNLEPEKIQVKAAAVPFFCPTCGSTEYEWNDTTFTRMCSYCRTTETEFPGAENVRAVSGNSELDDMTLEILEEVEKIQLDTIELDLSDDPTSIYSSKLGGPPYWEKDQEFPRNEAGQPLRLLAQLNFDKLPHIEGFPDHGILQFFIDVADIHYGASFEGEPTRQSGFRVIYTRFPVQEQSSELAQDISFADGENFPVNGVYRLNSYKTRMCLNEQSSNFYELMVPAYNRIFNDHAAKYDEISGHVRDSIEEQVISMTENCGGIFGEPGSRIGGSPYFIQWDPREADSEYDTLLLQIDSDYGNGKDRVLWGDAGVANFFINSEKLKNLDFSDIWYTWDCS